ncbi:hypothetical protein K502DRAFT_332216 [Neoconidiobolus thromboides FSU 785]|nr:hypothetical protein K502DRAFT_332216 [Neoconidiobolus thromboides FSU 785]
MNQFYNVSCQLPIIVNEIRSVYFQDNENALQKQNILEQNEDDQLLLCSAKNIKELLEAPEQIWSSIENYHFLDASKLYLENETRYQDLKKIQLFNQSMLITNIFPVIQIQYDILKNAASSTITKGKQELKKIKLDIKMIYEIFKSIELIEFKSMNELILIYLSEKESKLLQFVSKDNITQSIQQILNKIEEIIFQLIQFLLIYGREFVSTKGLISIKKSMNEIEEISNINLNSISKQSKIFDIIDFKKIILNWLQVFLQKLNKNINKNSTNSMNQLLLFKTFCMEYKVKLKTLNILVPNYLDLLYSIVILPNYIIILNNQYEIFYQNYLKSIKSIQFDENQNQNDKQLNLFNNLQFNINEDIVNLKLNLLNQFNQFQFNDLLNNYNNIRNTLNEFINEFNNLFLNSTMIYKQLDKLTIEQYFIIYLNCFEELNNQIEYLIKNSNQLEYTKDICYSQLLNKIIDEYLNFDNININALNYYHLKEEQEIKIQQLITKSNEIIVLSYNKLIDYTINEYSNILIQQWYNQLPIIDDFNIPSHFTFVDQPISEYNSFPTLITQQLFNVLIKFNQFVDSNFQLNTNKSILNKLFHQLMLKFNEQLISSISLSSTKQLIQNESKLSNYQFQFLLDLIALNLITSKSIEFNNILKLLNDIKFSPLPNENILNHLISNAKLSLYNVKLLLFPITSINLIDESVKSIPNTSITSLAPPCTRFTILEL